MSSTHGTDAVSMQQRLRRYLDERMEDLSRGLSALLVGPPASQDQTPLLRFARHAERASEQIAILERLVEEASKTGSRTLLFVVKGAGLRGWAARGMPGPFQVKSLSLPVSPDDLLGRAVETAATVIETADARPGNAAVAAMLGSGTPSFMLAAPLWVKDRVVAVLYVDAPGEGPWQPESASLMASIAALSLEALPYRTRYRRPELPPEAADVRERPVDATTSPAARRAPAAAAVAAAAVSVGGGEPRSIEPDLQESPDPEEQRLHEEARRFAALLVSEIVLYNEKQLEEGRRNKDLYERLKDDIDRSYRMFEQRVSSKISGASRYFREEIVRALAKGDESAIRLPWD